MDSYFYTSRLTPTLRDDCNNDSSTESDDAIEEQFPDLYELQKLDLSGSDFNPDVFWGEPSSQLGIDLNNPFDKQVDIDLNITSETPICDMIGCEGLCEVDRIPAPWPTAVEKNHSIPDMTPPLVQWHRNINGTCAKLILLNRPEGLTLASIPQSAQAPQQSTSASYYQYHHQNMPVGRQLYFDQGAVIEDRSNRMDFRQMQVGRGRGMRGRPPGFNRNLASGSHMDTAIGQSSSSASPNLGDEEIPLAARMLLETAGVLPSRSGGGSGCPPWSGPGGSFKEGEYPAVSCVDETSFNVRGGGRRGRRRSSIGEGGCSPSSRQPGLTKRGRPSRSGIPRHPLIECNNQDGSPGYFYPNMSEHPDLNGLLHGRNVLRK